MDEVAAVLDRVFPNREPTARSPVQQGNHKRTTLVTFPDREVVVQLADDADALATEAALATAVRDRTTVPVPEVVAVGTLDEGGYLVATRIRGTDLHERFTVVDAATRRRFARSFGHSLAELHEAFAFEAYGEVRVVDGALHVGDGDHVIGSRDWPEWFDGYLDAGLDALPPALHEFRDPVRDVAAETALPEHPTSRLFPWDLRPGNTLVEDGAVTAVLDWGGPLAAAPGLAVAKVEHLVCDWYVEDSRLNEAFRAGYEQVRSWPAVPRVYRLAAVVRSAVDSRGEVTRPRYPEETGAAAVAFHRNRLRSLL